MQTAPIGFFDSGLGGISVLREALLRYPAEDYLYYGDNGNAPYGEKTLEQTRALVDDAVAALLACGIKALVIACNTATSASAERLRARLDIPVIGMEPALKPAAMLRHGGQVLVLATPLTLKLEKFQRLMERYGEGVTPLPAPELVTLAEAGCLEGPRVDEALARITKDVGGQVDGVVLGCTHYSLMRGAVQAFFGNDVFIVDGNAGTVAQMARLLAARGELRPSSGIGSVKLITTGDEAAIAPLFWQLLQAQ